MAYTDELPDDVIAFLKSRSVTEFATLSQAGVPIDTPTYVFASDDLSTFDLATGLAYPAKAERARRIPKVGLLLEGGERDPVVSIGGYAAVRDADLQANLDRYVAETILTPFVDPSINDWSLVREAVFYLTRVFVSVAPVHVRWWPKRATMNTPPSEWRAPADAPFPASDPAPPGKASPAPGWPQKPWRELSDSAVASRLPAHLTLIDEEGFPSPIRAIETRQTDAGFEVDLPVSAPGLSGKATLSFIGREVFVGDASRDGGTVRLTVERALPILPSIADNRNVLDPDPATRDTMMARMRYEAARRAQPIPVVPEHRPEPTAGARLRAQASTAKA
jgi:hypothetical protein